MGAVVFPNWRADIVEALRLLGDIDLHEQWSKGVATSPALTDAVHWLIDDTWLDQKSAEELIPSVFATTAEADAVNRAIAALLAVLDDVGPLGGESAYVSHRGWPDVVVAAREALDALERPEG